MRVQMCREVSPTTKCVSQVHLLQSTECQPARYHCAIHKRLLRSATSKRSKEHRKLTIAKEKLIGWLKERLNGLDFYILQKSLCGTIKKNTLKLASVHEKKLQNLTRNTVLCASFLGRWRVTSLSPYSLTDEELDILKFSLLRSI